MFCSDEVERLKAYFNASRHGIYGLTNILFLISQNMSIVLSTI